MTDPVGRSSNNLYAVRVGEKHTAPGVSTVLKVLGMGDGLAWGAAQETALFAYFHPEEWQHLDEKAALARLRQHHRGVWTDKARRGTVVHDIANKWALGEEVDVPADCDPYVDALDAFWRNERPDWVHLERSVVSDETGREYGGTFDAIATTASLGTVLLDWKTGKRYPIETACQLAAYRHAKHIAVYDELGRLTGFEVLPKVDATAVVYLHDDGTYEFLEVPGDGSAFRTFLRLRDVWGWLQHMEKWLKKTPEKRVSAQEVAA